jgi:hypothetical protein
MIFPSSEIALSKALDIIGSPNPEMIVEEQNDSLHWRYILILQSQLQEEQPPFPAIGSTMMQAIDRILINRRFTASDHYRERLGVL